MTWIIRLIQNNGYEPLYWSNSDGWGDKDSATRFSDDEHRMFNLPIDGQWISLTAKEAQ